jgi:hypothetical protein
MYMKKAFDDLYSKILQETGTLPPPATTPPQQNQPQQGQPNPQQTKIDPNKLKTITDTINQLKDPTHIDAVIKLLDTLNNPNAANQQTKPA